MAVTLFRLSLFLVYLSTKYVSGQEVTVQQVSTTSLVLTWEKEGQWEQVNTYQVNVKMNDYDFCETTILCFLSSTCTFRSGNNHCGMFVPCANVLVTVSGGGYAAPDVNVVTAPAPVTDIAVKGLGNKKTITWTNPISACFDDTTATVTYGGYYDYTTSLAHDEASLAVFLCMKGTGKVEVRARGGSGESDPTSVTLILLFGDDAVKITECPPEGCTDVLVQWEYNEVCSDVTHLDVTLGANYSITTNVTTTNTTFTDLELNTQYDTCVYALDKDDNLLARHCTSCGTYPEVVEQLRLSNVTDVTAEIGWESPICPTDGDLEYKVSYSQLAIQYTNITTQTSFLWTNLNPATSYNLCVTVLHEGNPSAEPTCVKAFTVPAAPEEILARVYEETSLFVTWPAELFTRNLKYRVSWGDDLEHSNYTEYKSYTIDGYNKTVGPDIVCVEAETKNPEGLRSTKTCQESPFPNFEPDKPDHTAMIVGVSVSAGLAVVLSVALVVVAKTQERPSPRS